MGEAKWFFEEVGDVVKAILLKVPVLIFAVAMTQCESGGEVQWLTWDDSAEGTPAEVNVIESDADGTTLEVLIHGFFVEQMQRETSLGTMDFSRIILPRDSSSSCGATTSAGSAELPVIRRYIAVLSDAEEAEISGPAAYEIDEASVTSLEQVTVYPFQGFHSDEYPQVGFNLDEKFYESRIPFPLRYDKPPHLGFEVEAFHNLRVARVEMYPFVYIPADRVLQVYRRYTVRIEHSGQGHPEPLSSSEMYERMYSGLVANYQQIRPLLPPARQGLCGSYLIIIPEKYYANVMPLASWKRAKGLSVAVQTIPSQIDNTADDIKSAIASFYEEHPGDDVYVLLVGDVEDVASPRCEAYEWNELKEDSCSDTQYARVTGDDLLPDLFLGRLPAGDAATVDNAVKKILDYEKMPGGGDKTWLGKALLVAHKQDYPGGYTACKERVRSYSYSFAAPAFDTAYGGEEVGNPELRNALEDGRGIVNYRGHGGCDCWWTWGVRGQSWYINPDVATLANGEKTPIIFSISSLNNRISGSNCIGEAFVNLPQGGAVAYYGASADSGSAANNYLDRNLFRAAFDEGVHILGAVVNWAQVKTMEELSRSGAYSSGYNANIYLLLGDPEMSIRTREPQVFGSVEYPKWVEAGEQLLEVMVRDADGGPVAGALVILRKYKGSSASPDVEVNGYTRSDGKASFTISPATPGGLFVTVLKQDYVPYDGDGSFRVIHTERDADTGSFSFSWPIEPGRNYAVYVSDKLLPEPNWELTGISPGKEGLTMTLTDTTAGLARSRFYKVEVR